MIQRDPVQRKKPMTAKEIQDLAEKWDAIIKFHDREIIRIGAQISDDADRRTLTLHNDLKVMANDIKAALEVLIEPARRYDKERRILEPDGKSHLHE